ncbi:MAG TPA: hypothetical protein VGN39_05105 [Terriglobales bacterium]|nr:hypothetical protein [Terriglobales bacterium]
MKSSLQFDDRHNFMDRKSCKFVFRSLLLGFLFLGLSSFASQKPAAAKDSNPASAMIGPQPLPPPAPTPEQLPATAPQVSFKGGQLTIIARNSSLGTILQDVQTQTGATIDMPGNPSDRVVGQFGPGPAREVLASLLNGSHFNYVLLGSPQNPNVLQRIVLLAKSSASEEPTPSPQAASAFPAALPRQGAFVVANGDDSDNNDQDGTDDMAAQDQTAPDQTQQSNGDQNSQPTIKTPQQLLQELQRQRQVQQQGGSPDTPPPQLPGPQVK